MSGVKALVLAVLVACDSGASSGDGAQVFATVCITCHGPTGKPNEMMVAKLGVKDLTSPAVRKTLTADMIEQQVRDGSKNKVMPGFAGALSDAQIKAVAAYVASPQFLAH